MLLLVVASGMATARVPMVPVLVVVNFAIAIDGGVATAMAAPIGRLRNGLANDGPQGASDTTADDSTVAPAHRIADDGTGDGTNATADGSTERICTRGRREENTGKKKRENKNGFFHDAHLLD